MSTDNRVSMHNEKRKAKMQLKQIVAEMLRDEKTAKYYDNERRVLDTSKTKDNVVLVELEGDIDALRKKRIEAYNKKAKEEGKRRLREDANDAITTVLQLSKEYCETHSREEIIDAYKTMIEVMQEDPDEYGEVVCAVLHMDESTPHVQLVRLTVDVENLQNKNADMYGRTPKAMSHKQTDFAERLQKKGLNVTRGRNRVTNTFQKEAREFEEATGLKYDRLQDDLFEEFKRLQKEKEEAEKLADARREQEEEMLRAEKHKQEMQRVAARRELKEMYVEDLTSKSVKVNGEMSLLGIGTDESQRRYFGSNAEGYAERAVLSESADYLRGLSLEELRQAQTLRDEIRESVNETRLKRILDDAESSLEEKLRKVRLAKQRQKQKQEERRAKNARERQGRGPEL